MKNVAVPLNRSGRIPIRKIKSSKKQKISYQLSFFEQGKRKRTCYPSYEEALQAWKQHNHLKIRYASGPFKYDRKAHIEHSQAKELAGQDVSLVDAVKFWLKYHRRPEKAPTLTDAITAFLEHIEKLGRSRKHYTGSRSMLGILSKSFGQQPVDKITSNQVLEWLLSRKDLQPETIHNYHSCLSNFFNYCKRRKWLEDCPTDNISGNDLPTVPKKPKGVLTVAQTAAMFECLEDKYARFVAWFALQAFAGIRRAETVRFRWDWLDFAHKRIVLPGWIFCTDAKPQRGTKSAEDWVMQGLPDNLWVWLERYRQHRIRVQYPDPLSDMAIRRELAELGDHPINPWPHNALRHTFATMHISLSESADKTALLMRHRSTRKLYQNYLAEIVPQEEAQRYFSIVPQKA